MNIEEMVELNNLLHVLMEEVGGIKNQINGTKVFVRIHPTLVAKMAAYEGRLHAVITELKSVDAKDMESVLKKHGIDIKELKSNGSK